MWSELYQFIISMDKIFKVFITIIAFTIVCGALIYKLYLLYLLCTGKYNKVATIGYNNKVLEKDKGGV